MRFLLTPANYDLADPVSIPNLLVQHLQICLLYTSTSPRD